MMVNGLMIKRMVMEFISISTELFTKVNGRKIYSMVRAMKNGLMDLLFWVNMLMDKKMDMASINGLMVLITKVNGKKIKSLVLECIHG